MSRKNVIFWRVYLSFFFLVLLAVGILFKMIKIQTVEGAYWRAQADSLTTRIDEVEPNRGNIYAADGSLLATSLYVYDIRMDTKANGLSADSFNKNIDALAQQLSMLFKGANEKTAWEWKNAITKARKNGNRYFYIRENVNHIQLKALRKMPLFRDPPNQGGFIAEQRSVRKRPFKLLAQRTIGYERNDNPVVGIEGAYNSYLAGTIGKRLMQKVSSRVWIPINDNNEVEPKNGLDVYTTIDINFQDFAERALHSGLVNNKADHGCAIVMETATGHIKAIANLGLDNENYYELYNYAIGTRTEPGSTFKLAPLLTLLEHGYMAPEDTIQTGDGLWQIYTETMRDDKIGGYGTLTLSEVMEKSSNIGIAKAMEKYYKHQPESFINFLQSFHLDKPSGLGIKGEPNPFIKVPQNNSEWSGTTLYWMAHGYELELTPLQTLSLFNLVANKGTLMKPTLVTEIKEMAKTVEVIPAKILAKNVISERTAQQATQILKAVVEKGTATSVASNQLTIAGKTGTTVLSKIGDKKKYQSSFAGFFPADNPKYSCIVVVSNPEGDHYYGSAVAGPIFKEIAECIYAYDMELHPSRFDVAVRNPKKRPTFKKAQVADLQSIYNHLNLEMQMDENSDYDWAEPFLTGNKITLKSKQDVLDKVPNVKGLSLSDAFYICENSGLLIQYSGSGVVYRQVPDVGASLKRGSIIYLNLK